MRVIITRASGQAGPLAEAIEALGHEVVHCPVLEIEPIGDGPVDTTGYDWVVVTSVNGVAEFCRRRRGPLPRVAAIGPGTAEALADQGIEPDLIPAVSTQEGLVEELPRPHGRVLFAGAEGARPFLVEVLGADFVPLYRTVAVRPKSEPEGDLVVLASASAARAFAALGRNVPAVSIGPQTTRAARDAGLHVVSEAESHDFIGLVSAVSAAAAPR